MKKTSCSSFFNKFLNKLLITGLLTISLMILIRKNLSFKTYFNDKVIGVNFDFAYVNSFYHKYFGGAIPFSDLFQTSVPVFSESLTYNNKNPYMDGVSLNVGTDYMVPSISTGLVVFVGEKDGYGNTVIVQGVDGVDIWYSNLNSINVSIYEYLSEGGFIGSCSDNLYMVFKKDGIVLDYEKFI